MPITITDILTLIRKIVDIAIVWVIFYYFLKNIKNNIKLSLLFKGVVFIIILKVISGWFGFITVGILLEYIIQWGPLALIVIFQPEIRSILEQLGRTQLLGRHKVLTVDERERMVYEIVNAVDAMKKSKTGALIVIERDISLGNYIERSKKLYADLSTDLIEAVFPTSTSTAINGHLGTRHRAALGLSEETDALIIVVSEETGKISIALKGELLYGLSIDDVRMMLIDELRPKAQVDVIEEEEDEE